MIIGIDASGANKERKTGVEWYAYNLINEMKKLSLKSGDKVFLYSPVALKGELADLPTGWEEKTLKWNFPGWNTFRLSWEMIRRKPDVFFEPSNKLPIVLGKFNVTTIHDIGPDRIPEAYSRGARRSVLRATARAVRKAVKIIAVSEFTKNELILKYRVSADKITVVHNATYFNLESANEQKISSILDKYNLSRGLYFLHIGRIEKKKNIANLVRAFEIFKQGMGAGDPHTLVLAGSAGFGSDEVIVLIAASKFRDGIKRLDYIAPEDLPALIKGAHAYVFPSLYEGFGIPALEAMALGVPLIASDIGALREMAQGSALFAPPNDIVAWAEAMHRVVMDQNMREEMIKNGLSRAQEFSWRATAEKTLEVLSDF